MAQIIKILFVGDIAGPLGMTTFQKHGPALKRQHNIDFVIVNGENACDGRGLTPRLANSLKHNGADVITSGNHIWAKKEIFEYLNTYDDVLRPANYPSACPGTGVAIKSVGEYKIGVINVQGRVFMREHVADPFTTVDSLLTFVKSKTNIVIVDFHAETTSEKTGMGLYLDGKVSAVLGTHTHVQTADERVLPGGTAYITDVGMTGALDSMIGMKKEPILTLFLTQMPQRFLVETTGRAVLGGVILHVDAQTGKAVSIERVRIIDDEISV